MKGIFSIFRKDEKAFTGLESAIVLTAFVVVAAVFSYVVLGAGFTTSDTAKKTIDEGVKQTTSSVELAGDVIAKGTPNATNPTINYLIVTLQLTAGQSPVDIGNNSSSGMMVISYSDSALYFPETEWEQKFIGDDDGDDVLEQHEKVQITIDVPVNSNLQSNIATNVVNTEFRIEVKPKIGAIVPVTRVTPPQIDAVMNLK
ncbi:flagellin [Methanosarcina sp. 2.H.T.1A.6]|uniref:archaellin/type IV pilin N-terminal domain-containing protein n=1 Tax=unclassified Methanosarcina TaxID=2644672 RepID=UPI000621817D|nr:MULTISPECIES: archaellin/type IV pilin N-terminal domain-containing protein [unclassified Methanosarcina]KKG16340.1 flagellin [Methanosarcina sp. 2.H.T.1A.3]KKG16646.1 flagellin [Methanosarcina sp. 2.H.T.1A.15]KKG19508.1 flagellin [Methanosarcina sp. 2.H.T.1A.6]KKG21813.1 flagellin [Methanosarcina sp. 2.H.T.1A.8]